MFLGAYFVKNWTRSSFASREFMAIQLFHICTGIVKVMMVDLNIFEALQFPQNVTQTALI